MAIKISLPGRIREGVKTARSVLNELRWRRDRDFSKVGVEYVHRGAPNDVASVGGGDIIALEPWMMVVRRRDGAGRVGRRQPRSSPVPGQAAIPYHRIVRITYDGAVVFSRARTARGHPPPP